MTSWVNELIATRLRSVRRLDQGFIWWDYCEAKGGAVEQEYKAKRRATALAKKLIKEG